jgi:hypothetical protein
MTLIPCLWINQGESEGLLMEDEHYLQVIEWIKEIHKEITELKVMVFKLRYGSVIESCRTLSLTLACGMEPDEPFKAFLEKGVTKEKRKNLIGDAAEFYEIDVERFFSDFEEVFPDMVKLAEIIPFRIKPIKDMDE